MRSGARAVQALSLSGLALAVLAFWQLRVVAPATETGLFYQTIDLYTEHLPMAAYGFAMLRSGNLPLWNPYQLCGLPFLAVPHTGLFYPGNFAYWLFDAALATELCLILHLFWAAASSWFLARSLSLGALAGLAAAVSYTWSSWLMTNLHQPAVLDCMAWLPATLWAIERSVRGGRLAPLGLALAVACQVANGATEVLVYNLYAAGLFAAFRLAARFRKDGAVACLRSAATLLLFLALGIAAASVQLLPSLELAGQSVRLGTMTPTQFLAGSLTNGTAMLSLGTAGLLTWIGIGAGPSRNANLWCFSVVLGSIGLLLASGGSAYTFFHDWFPFVSSFRFPAKLLLYWSLSQSLLAALGMQRLVEWIGTRRIAARPGWLGATCLLLGATALAWSGHGAQRLVPWALALAGLASFAVVERAALRRAVVVALLLVQAGTFFLGTRNDHIRPLGQPGIYASEDSLFRELRASLGSERVYVSPVLRLQPGLTLKQGMLQHLRFAVDYETLAPRRWAQFFAAVAGPDYGLLNSDLRILPLDWFAGFYRLGPGFPQAAMDLTATRFYVLDRFEPLSRRLAKLARRRGAGLHLWKRGDVYDVYERDDPLPRALLVPRARSVSSANAALAALLAPGFSPRRELLLEGPDPLPDPGSEAPLDGWARIATDEAERVVVDYEASRPAFLLLADSWYPGWEARVNGEPAEILRANYVFRAVQVPAGRGSVAFEYRPASFRRGAWISAAALLLLGVLSGRRLRGVVRGARNPADTLEGRR